MGMQRTESHELPMEGVILAWAVDAAGQGRPLGPEVLPRDLSAAGELLWLHVNLADRRVIRWLEAQRALPEDLRSSLRDRSAVSRYDAVTVYEDALLFKLSDFRLDLDRQDDDNLRFAHFWCYLTENVLISGRYVPLRTFDEVRQRLQQKRFLPRRAVEVFHEIIEVRSLFLDQAIERLSGEVDALEDVIISDGELPANESIGRIRILCNRVRRTFNQEKLELYHLLRKTPPGMAAVHREALEEHYDDLNHSLDQVDSLSNRARVVQEEQTAHVADRNARNLNVLSVVTVFFLPMTLVTGVMGMNMDDLPGLKGSFYLVMAMMAGLCLLVYVLLRIKKLL